MSFPWANHYEPKQPLMRWLDEKLPLPRMAYNAVGAGYPVPRNLNYRWNFGVLASAALAIQIITGIVLAMHFHSSAAGAFDSVNGTIMRDVNAGWFLRYAHANGASMFLAVVYIHIFRGLFYGTYKAPREVVWLLGGYAPDDATLNRFFSLHYMLPFVIAGVIILHIWALHIPGSSNPTGVEVKSESDTVPFHPYYTAKDGFGLGVFLLLYCAFLFFMPNALGHPDYYIPANPLSTPALIVPEWYFWPCYAILRAFTVDLHVPFTHVVFIPAKLLGVMAMFASMLVWFFLPWLDRSP